MYLLLLCAHYPVLMYSGNTDIVWVLIIVLIIVVLYTNWVSHPFCVFLISVHTLLIEFVHGWTCLFVCPGVYKSYWIIRTTLAMLFIHSRPTSIPIALTTVSSYLAQWLYRYGFLATT